MGILEGGWNGVGGKRKSFPKIFPGKKRVVWWGLL